MNNGIEVIQQDPVAFPCSLDMQGPLASFFSKPFFNTIGDGSNLGGGVSGTYNEKVNLGII